MMLQPNSLGFQVHEGCGAVGRQHKGTQSITRSHKSSRAASKQTLGLPGGWSSQTTSNRPGSAKYWVEKKWQQQEKQAMKRIEMEKTNNNIKLAQFRANFHNSEPSAPRCLGSRISFHEEEENSKPIKKLYSLSPPKSLNSMTKKDEFEEPSTSPKLPVSKSFKPILDSTDTMLPEVASLKQRLEELHSKNEEERRKLNEELCYRAWKNNSKDYQKMESNRFNEFVRSAWLEQKKWRQDEAKRKQIEERKFEEESEKIRKLEEERDRRLFNEKEIRREELQRELEKQLEMIKLQNRHEAEVREVEDWLQVERERIMAMEEKLKAQMHARKSKALAVTWAKQHHIKLRQKAVQVMDDVAEDEILVKEMQKHKGPLPLSLQSEHFKNYTNINSKESDCQWVMSILSEHKKLEKIRQQEYDLLFSEEAARLFRCREQQWEQEQKARDNLLQEVLLGRRQQIEQKLKQNEARGNEVSVLKEQSGNKLSEVESELSQLEQTELVPSSELREERTEIVSDGTEKHRSEIARLEREMSRLWGPMYTPPSFGRKKSQLM